ncbi:MAG: tetratricopeptide repeat protein, partial [Candidatus Heimdallarchaeaceae archaeon]
MMLQVIDNFETIIDQNIVNFLKNLPSPSKALLTSRKRMGEVERVVELKEFSKDETITFLKNEFNQRNMKIPDFEQKYEEIHKITGGIPLALKMVVAWVINEGYSLEVISEKLLGPKSDILDFCFKENYENHMEENTRRVFCVFPIFDSEPTYDQLKATTKLKEDELDYAISKLLNLSLIFEIHNETSEADVRQYGMLPLTMMFAYQKLTENRGLEQEARKSLSEFLELNQQTQEAIEQIESALLEVGGQTPKGRMAAQYANLGYANYQRGNYDEAVRLCELAISTNPKLSYSYQVYATIERLQGNYTKSDELFKKASHLNPKNPIIWSSWAMLRADYGDFVSAQTMLKTAQKLDPKSPHIKQQLAVIKSKLGHYEESIKIASKNMNVPPRDRRERYINKITLTSLIETYWKQGLKKKKTDIKRSLDIYKKALEELNNYFEYCFQNNQKLIHQKHKILRAIGIAYRNLKSFQHAEEFLN